MTWTRLARRLGADHNPLRRRSDLIEAWLLPCAIAAFLVLAPVVAAGAVWWSHAQVAAARHAQQSWRRVPAVLLRAAPGPMISGGGSNTWTAREPARWVAGAQPRTGLVPVPSGTRAGTHVMVWLDRAGLPQPLPLTASQARDRVVVALSAALAALAVALAVLALVIRWRLNRRRLASWAADWESVGPQWSHQE
jgi:hypothetical protein